MNISDLWYTVMVYGNTLNYTPVPEVGVEQNFWG